MSDAITPRSISIRGRSFMVDRACWPEFWDLVEAGDWEPLTLEALERFAPADGLLIDIGAWIGPTALFAAAGGARVVAVEPDPVAQEGLRRNLALNPSLAGRVVIVDCALGATEGEVRMAPPTRGAGGDSMSSMLDADVASGGWQARVMTPRALRALAGGAPAAMVKIDIEGGEYLVGPSLGPIVQDAGAVLLSWHPRAATAGRRGLARAARWVWLAWRTTLVLRQFTAFYWAIAKRERLRRHRFVRAWVGVGGVALPARHDWLFTRAPLDGALAAAADHSR